MSNRQYCAIFKFRTNRFLNKIVRFHVDGSCGFVQYQHFGLSEQSSSKANQLSLADTVSTTATTIVQ